MRSNGGFRRRRFANLATIAAADPKIAPRATLHDAVAAARINLPTQSGTRPAPLGASADAGLVRQPREVRGEADNRSLELARDVVAALGSHVKLPQHPQRWTGFAILTAPNIPSVVVELGCLSNPIEEGLLQLPAYRKRLARGLARAIELYFSRRDLH